MCSSNYYALRRRRLFLLLGILIIGLLLGAGLGCLIVLLVWSPLMNLNITDASLTQFNIPTGDPNLHYNMAMNLAVQNPDKPSITYNDQIYVRAYYQNQRFGSTTLQPFYQRGMNTTNFDGIILSGQQPLDTHYIDHKFESRYDLDSRFGLYDIGVEVSFRARFANGLSKTHHRTYYYYCHMKVPLNVDGNRTSSSGTSCTMGYGFQ